MAELINNALLISAIGMGLVFLSLILIWWLMEAIVRLFRERKSKATVEVLHTAPIPDIPELIPEPSQLKKQAAAAAVAYALASHPSSQMADEGSPSVSPWQVALRTRSFSARSSAFGRKPQRNVK